MTEMTDAELATKVAEGMGLEEFDGGYWVCDFDGDYRAFCPLGRADHWWMVLEWVRELTVQERFKFTVELELSLGVHKHLGAIVPVVLLLFGDKRPGRAICEAFVEVFCG